MLNLFKTLINRKSWLIPLLMTIAYAIISGVNLAQISGNPSATWIGDYRGKSITFIFDKPTEFHSIRYFMGLSNGKFKVSIQTESDVNLQIMKIDTSSFPPPVYQWNSIILNQNLFIKQLSFSIESPIVEFKQFAIFDNKGKLVTNYRISMGYSNSLDKIDTLFATTKAPKNYAPSIKSSIFFLPRSL